MLRSSLRAGLAAAVAAGALATLAAAGCRDAAETRSPFDVASSHAGGGTAGGLAAGGSGGAG
ncbi:hypothetical protein BE15_45320, partial [Sorangium cellulosum]